MIDAAVECPACQANLLHPVSGDGPSDYRKLDLEGRDQAKFCREFSGRQAGVVGVVGISEFRARSMQLRLAALVLDSRT